MRKMEANWDLRRISHAFPYLRLLMREWPEGREEDTNYPSMDRGHRAKVFAPFDALDGFSELIGQKDRLREETVPEKTEENICISWGNL